MIISHIQWSSFVFLISLCVFGFSAVATETSYEKWQKFFKKKEDSNGTAIVNYQGVSEPAALDESSVPESLPVEGELLPGFKSVRGHVRSLGIRTVKEYREWVKSGVRSDNVPAFPEITDRSKGEIERGFLSMSASKKFMSYEGAKSATRIIRSHSVESETNEGRQLEASHPSDDERFDNTSESDNDKCPSAFKPD